MCFFHIFKAILAQKAHPLSLSITFYSVLSRAEIFGIISAKPRFQVYRVGFVKVSVDGCRRFSLKGERKKAG